MIIHNKIQLKNNILEVMLAGNLFYYSCLTLICLMLYGCTTSKIKLQAIPDNIPVITMESSNVLLVFNKKDICFLTDSLLKKDKNKSMNEQIMFFEKLSISLCGDNTKNIILFIDDISQQNTEEQFVKIALIQQSLDILIRQGKVRVFNKLKNSNEKTIVVRKVRTKLGGCSEYFYFLDGREFYSIMIILGE